MLRMELVKTVRLRLHKGNYGRTITYTITLPKDFVEALGWQPGEKLQVILDTVNREIRVRTPS